MVTSDGTFLRVMVDANVLVAGVGWPRWPYEVLQHAVRGDFQLVLTPLVIDEARRSISRLLPDSVDRFEEFLQISRYEEAPTPTKAEVESHADLMHDPADVPVALAAMRAEVDCFVTLDRDF